MAIDSAKDKNWNKQIEYMKKNENEIMKITIYELLGLIKDNKAPKKIKYHDAIFTLREEKDDYINAYTWFTNEIGFYNLNDEVEIMEERKDDEIKLLKSLNNVGNCIALGEFTDKQQLNNHLLKNKLNELIKEINKMKEGK